MLEFSGHVIGLAMVIGSLVVFVLLITAWRASQPNPPHRFCRAGSPDVLDIPVLRRGVMALAGFPLGMGVGTK